MKFRSIALFLVPLLALCASQSRAETMAARGLVIDGLSGDFAADEEIFTETEELNFDSYWGENNDLNQMKATWDSDNLYIAVDGRIWGNNLLVYFDTDETRGIYNADLLNSWARKLEFLHRYPDFFFGTWDNNTAPQMWELPLGNTREVEQITTFLSVATFSQGQTGASLEGAIPWTTLYGDLGDDTVPPGAEIAIVAAIVSGGDHTSGPDCAPNNLLGMTNTSSDICTIDNYVILHIDRDEDGQPDLGVSPAGREGDHVSEDPPLTFLRDPRVTSVKLEFDRAEALRAAFSPDGDGEADEAEIVFRASVDYRLTVDILDPNGRQIRSLLYKTAIPGGEDLIFTWDGRDDEGRIVEAGVYLACLNLDGNDRVNIPLAVVR